MQENLHRMMASVGGKDGGEGLVEADLEWLEKVGEKYSDGVAFEGGFVRAGANEASVRFHFARVVCRRAEREFVRFVDGGANVAGSDVILKYLNRLSDVMFVLAVKFG